MEEHGFRRVAGTFRRFHQRFAPLFGRKEARRHSEQYVRGLLVHCAERRNAENLAEAVVGSASKDARALQQFLTNSPWACAPVTAALQGYLAERLLPQTPEEGVASDGVWTLDSTGFAKRGRQSAGVSRQYSGTLGKVDTCQLGVFLGYATARGQALVDGRLYLPREWLNDAERCRRAGVPEAVLAPGYQSQADLGLGLLRRARETGALVGRWVVADAAFGQVPTFRDALDAAGAWYLVDVPRTTPVFLTLPQTEEVRLTPDGPSRTVTIQPAAQTVDAVATALPAGEWTPLTVAEGAQGPRRAQFAARRVWERREELPGRACWLVLRRPLDGTLDDGTPKYFLSNAPEDTPLATLARVSATRWTIETEFQTTKGHVGLDEYEVRSWPGWHHHVTLCLLANAFLLSLQQDWTGAGEKERRGRARAAPRPRDGSTAPGTGTAPGAGGGTARAAGHARPSGAGAARAAPAPSLDTR